MAEMDRISISSKNQKDYVEPEKLSIGQYLNRKSGRISSLVGSVPEKDFPLNTTGFSRGLLSLTLSEKSWEEIAKQSASKSSSFLTDKTKFKPEMAINDWALELSSLRRESTESKNTVNIQNLIATLGSGLSGTEIYECN